MTKERNGIFVISSKTSVNNSICITAPFNGVLFRFDILLSTGIMTSWDSALSDTRCASLSLGQKWISLLSKCQTRNKRGFNLKLNQFIVKCQTHNEKCFFLNLLFGVLLFYRAPRENSVFTLIGLPCINNT